MSLSVSRARPGDVLAVWSGDSFVDEAIRVGEWFQGKTPIANHVVIVTHQDQAGRWLGIEGRPGGVGAVDCSGYLGNPRTRSNYAQPRNEDMTAMFLASAAKSLGIGYDWVGIAEDILSTLHAEDLSKEIDFLWRWPKATNLLPGHVVCSSLAAWLYSDVGWAHPSLDTDRMCEPADWWDWSNKREWLIPGQ